MPGEAPVRCSGSGHCSHGALLKQANRAIGRNGKTHTESRMTMGPYEKKLNELVSVTNALEGTGGSRALKTILKDLSGHGPISELLYTLDRQNFDRVIDLLVEFRNSGRNEPFNAIHETALKRLK